MAKKSVEHVEPKYRLERSEGSDSGGFSFYVHKIRVPTVALDKLQPHLPAVGHLFRIGAVQRNVADKLLRTVDLQVNTELPIITRHWVNSDNLQ